ncbi:alpha/beta hydrolase [Acidobacteria bacterium AB60]|nr:alpha/beta hydrolase [Acidobacteria bacterium AB60]
MQSAILSAGALLATPSILPQTEHLNNPKVASRHPFVLARDGTRLYVQDWGSGRPLIFLSAWTFQSNVWGGHMATLTKRGFRCVAPDRRGYGRSEAPRTGYDLDTMVDDLSMIMDELDLRDAVLVAHSMGAFEATHYLATRGANRIARLVLVAPTTPSSVKTEDNPEGWPKEAIEAQHELIARDFPRWIGENEEPFFTPDTSQETRRWIKNMMMSASIPVALATAAATSTADVRSDLAKITCPTLIVHGDKDASAPLAMTGARTARLIPNSKLIVYHNAPHAIILTHQKSFLNDLLAFIES